MPDIETDGAHTVIPAAFALKSVSDAGQFEGHAAVCKGYNEESGPLPCANMAAALRHHDLDWKSRCPYASLPVFSVVLSSLRRAARKHGFAARNAAALLAERRDSARIVDLPFCQDIMASVFAVLNALASCAIYRIGHVRNAAYYSVQYTPRLSIAV